MTVAKGQKIRLRGQWGEHCDGVQKKRKGGQLTTQQFDDSPLIPFWLSQPSHVFCFPCRVLCRVAEHTFLHFFN